MLPHRFAYSECNCRSFEYELFIANNAGHRSVVIRLYVASRRNRAQSQEKAGDKNESETASSRSERCWLFRLENLSLLSVSFYVFFWSTACVASGLLLLRYVKFIPAYSVSLCMHEIFGFAVRCHAVA